MSQIQLNISQSRGYEEYQLTKSREYRNLFTKLKLTLKSRYQEMTKLRKQIKKAKLRIQELEDQKTQLLKENNKIFNCNSLFALKQELSTQYATLRELENLVAGTEENIKGLECGMFDMVQLGDTYLSTHQKIQLLGGGIDTAREIIKTLMEMDELSISNKLLEYRKQQPNFKDISFTTICAYRENAALMHYHPTEKQYSKVEASHLLLIDSGGQYLTGTTDITRTFVLGEMTPEERKDFTIALKAMFRLQNAHFIQDVTTGANLDILARGVIYDYDLDYRCGTGHGVGHFLNVHEGPNGLRPKSLYGHEACIVPGMITTDEPGVYVEGSHGIRHENELLCVKHTENEYGTFLKFEPITYVPFDIEGLDLNYLSNHEIASINEYQQNAFDHIKDALTQEEKDWYLNNLFIK